MQVFHDPSVCQLRVVIDNFALVISAARGNMYIRQMNICGQINLLLTLQIHEMLWFLRLYPNTCIGAEGKQIKYVLDSCDLFA